VAVIDRVAVAAAIADVAAAVIVHVAVLHATIAIDDPMTAVAVAAAAGPSKPRESLAPCPSPRS